MEYLAGIGIIAWVVLMAVVVCITIAPLIIWRNTNRTNRLLEDLLDEVGRTNDLLAGRLAANRQPPGQSPPRPTPQGPASPAPDAPGAGKPDDFELS